MIPAALITFREIIEAILIVATILGILTRLKQSQSIRTVWLGTIIASLVSVGLLVWGSLLGLKVQEFYESYEPLFEGIMMIVSAIFITWAVFWLHKYFVRQKLVLLQKVKSTIARKKQAGLFALVFTAVLREGLEIVLFLSTIYLSAKPLEVVTGFGIGAILGLLVAVSIFTATLKLPIYRAFQTTTVLLVLFAAGLAARGAHEFTEAGLIPEFTKITLAFLPANGHAVGDTIKSIFGLSQSMDYLQLTVYASYIAFMRWYLYLRKKSPAAAIS